MSLIKTFKNCIFTTVAFSRIIYFPFKIFLSKCYTKFQPQGSYNLGSFVRVSTVCRTTLGRDRRRRKNRDPCLAGQSFTDCRL